MFKHSHLLDRSRANLSQLALKRRVHRLVAKINHHLDHLETVEHEFSKLPECLRDEHLLCVIDHQIDNSCGLLERTKAWKFEQGEILEEKVVENSEEYLKRCIAVVEDIGEAVQALRALVAEEEEVEEEAVKEQDGEDEEDDESGNV
jgi:hypothetical protein